MTREQLASEISRLTTENAKLRGKAIPRKAKRAKPIDYPRAYGCSTYSINATVYPKSRVILDGERPDPNVLDASRGRGMHKVLPFRTEFKVGDEAVYHGYNFDYFGVIVAIGPKTVTIDERCGSSRKHRLSIRRFAFWNRRSKEISIRERQNWCD